MKVRVRTSSIDGRGVFAIVDIAAGESIFDNHVSDGASHVVMTDDELAAYITTVERYSARAIGPGLHQVSLDPENPAEMGNHSCDPNAWLADDKASLVARRSIRAGDEITTDYAFWSDAPDWRMECNCSCSLCRRVVTGRDWELGELQERYRGHWPTFLEERMDRPS